MSSPIRRLSVAAIIALLFFASCDRRAESSKVGGGVIAAESFLADIARNVAGEGIAISTLVPLDSDPHEFQPRPADIARIRSSRALIVSGRGYEAWLAPSMGALEGTRVIVASGPGDSGGDPHLWMDPRNVTNYVENIRVALSELYPASAAVFSANASTYSKGIADLDSRVRSKLAVIPPQRRLLLTNHDALGHFASAYGFKVIGTVLPGTSTESAPSAKTLARLVDSIRSSGARAIFLDVGENMTIAKEIAKEGGVRVVTDLYVEGVSAPEGPAPTYFAMIEHDAEVIADALK